MATMIPSDHLLSDQPPPALQSVSLMSSFKDTADFKWNFRCEDGTNTELQLKAGIDHVF